MLLAIPLDEFPIDEGIQKIEERYKNGFPFGVKWYKLYLIIIKVYSLGLFVSRIRSKF